MRLVSISVNDKQIFKLLPCLESQKALEGYDFTLVDSIECKLMLSQAIEEYEAVWTLEDIYSKEPWVIADYARIIYLSDNQFCTYIDHDVLITDPEIFTSQLELTSMEVNNSTGLFNNGIICNITDCELFHELLVYWMKQPITNQMFSATGFMAKKNGFGKIDKGFTHYMYSVNLHKGKD